MIKPYFSITTISAYVLIGIILVLFLISRTSHNSVRRKYTNVSSILFVLLLTVFATFRLVGDGIGGQDALSYINRFVSDDFDRGLDIMEPLYIFFNRAIRFFTSDYHVFFFIIYGFIAYSYLVFIKKIVPNKISYIPFILLAYLYVRGFNTLRTSLSVSFILFGVCYIGKKWWISLVFFISSIFIHRVSLLFLPLYILYHFFANHKQLYLSRKSFFFSIIIGIALSYSVSVYLQNLTFLSALLEGTNDAYYLKMSADESLLSAYPMYFGQALLAIFVLLNFDKIKKHDNIDLLLICLIYDLWVIPAANILGMWRSMEYLYLCRLSLWGIIIYELCKSSRPDKVIIIKISSFFLFVFWFVFRFYSEWEPMKISPYVFDLL